MVASETVSPASGNPAAAAERSSPSTIARAIPRRRWVAATVTPLTAQAGRVRPGEMVRSVAQHAMVPTGNGEPAS